MGIPENPFETRRQPGGKLLSLAVHGRLRDRSWGFHFGEHQRALADHIWRGNRFSQLRLDLTNCTWADPTPLLSLFMSIYSFCDAGGEAEVRFPDSGPEESRRFLEFAFQEGFLGALVRRERQTSGLSILVGGAAINDNTMATLASIGGYLAYKNMRLLPASMLWLGQQAGRIRGVDNLSCPDDIDEWVDGKLTNIIAAEARAKIPAWAWPGLRYRVQTILRETLHNVLEHAYRGEGGYAAVYLRFRRGFPAISGTDLASLRDEYKLEEESHAVPLLSSSFADLAGFIELFVIDEGIGLCRSLESIVGRNLSVQEYSLAAFRDGKSSKPAEKRITAAGGLRALRDLLEPYRDAVRVRDVSTWWGTRLPFGDGPKEAFNVAASNPQDTEVQGLALAFRLSWDEPTDPIGDYWCTWEGPAPSHVTELYRVGAGTSLSPAEVQIVDLRNSDRQQDLRGESNAIICLPPENWDKNNVAQTAFALTKHLKSNGIMIFGDIPQDQAAAYVSAFDGLTNNYAVAKARRIYLVTRRLTVCTFKRSDDGFASDKDACRQFLMDSEELPTSISGYLKLLREHDSSVIWRAVGSETREAQAFVRGQIEWPPGALTSYLDFGQTLTRRTCRRIYQLSLWRLLAILQRDGRELKSLDSLTDSLVSRFNALQPGKQREACGSANVFIGSVQVSGATASLAMDDYPSSQTWHFFRHPDATVPALHLLLWPRKEWLEKFPIRERYERVGRTPVIARDGWKSYGMPRFRRVAGVGAKSESIYGASPRTSYAQWQDPHRQLMKVGHWTYGGHHDLLTVNLLAAFDPQLDLVGLPTLGEVAIFAFGRLIELLNIPKGALNDDGKKILDRSGNAPARTASIDEPILVYPSHPVTDHIVDRFVGLLTEQFANKFRDRVIALFPIRGTRSGSALLVSGLLTERLQSLSRAMKSRSAVILDDAVLTGRTYQEVKRILKHHEFKTIYSVVLVDRQRLPSADYVKKRTSACYWRLDVPPLGSEMHCPLCHALSVANSFLSTMGLSPYRDRLATIVAEWRPKTPTADWGEHGLPPVPLNLANAWKKFGIEEDPENPGSYRQSGGDDNKVHISSAIGLVAYISEFHSMTSRDDLPIVLIKEKEVGRIPLGVRIELIASQLFLFPGEFSAKTETEMLEILLDDLLLSEEGDNFTALCLLALLSRPVEVVARAYRAHFRRLGVQATQQLERANVDYVNFCAYLVQQELIPNDADFARAARLIKGAPSVVDAYWHFHLEAKDSDGRSHHSPLHRLRDTDTPESLDQLVSNGVACAARALSVLESILNSRGRVDTEFSKLISLKKRASELLETLTARTKDYLEQPERAFNNPEDPRFVSIRDAGCSMIDCLGELHEYFFLPIALGLGGQRERRNILQEIGILGEDVGRLDFGEIAKQKGLQLTWDRPAFSVLPEIRDERSRVGGNVAERYVVWDEMTRTAIKDLLANVVYAPEVMKSPLPCSVEEAHMFIHVLASDEYLEIQLINRSKSSAHEIERAVLNHRSAFLLREIGGEVSYRQLEAQVICAVVRLPYANRLFGRKGS